MSVNQAIHVTCDGKSVVEIYETGDTFNVHERVYPSYPVDKLDTYLEYWVKVSNSVCVESILCFPQNVLVETSFNSLIRIKKKSNFSILYVFSKN